MSFARNSASMATLAAVLGIAGCATTGGNLSSSSERLQNSAYELREDARDAGANSNLTRDADVFAEEARDFREVVRDHRGDDDDVQDAFRELSERYHALRDEVERTRSSEADKDFRPVTEAYLDVEREVRGSNEYESDRYARDRYGRED